MLWFYLFQTTRVENVQHFTFCRGILPLIISTLAHQSRKSFQIAMKQTTTQKKLFHPAPLSVEVEPKQQVVDYGRPASFKCNYKGNPVKSISWMKNGEDIGHNDPVLRINSVKKEDRGMYQCFVRNDQV